MAQMNNPLGAAVRQIREELELSQAEVARRMGVGQSHLAHLEAGRRNPSDLTVFRLASAMEIPYLEFCERIGRRPTTMRFIQEYVEQNHPTKARLVRGILELDEAKAEALLGLVEAMNQEAAAV